MEDSIVKIQNYKEQEYSGFIRDLKFKYSQGGYVPCGIDKLTQTHGTAIYKAYLSHLKLKQEG